MFSAFLNCLPQFYRQALALELTIQLDWMTSQPTESSCFCPPSFNRKPSFMNLVLYSLCACVFLKAALYVYMV